jgi:hypothetical protein
LLIAAAVPLVCAFWSQAPPKPTGDVQHQTAFRIALGVGDSQATTWDGKVSLERGRIEKLEGWRFEETDQIMSDGAWRLSTRPSVSRPMKLPFTQWRDVPQPPIPPNGVIVTTEGPPEDRVRVGTAQGNFEFSLQDVELGGKRTFLNGRAEVEGVPATVQVAGGKTQNDYPSLVVSRSGETWVTWVAHENGADSVMARRLAGGVWSEPVRVSEPAHTDVFNTAIAQDASGRIWVVWSSQIKGNWDLHGRSWNGGRWSPIERITEDSGPDIYPRMAASAGGKLYLIWQGFRHGRSNILMKVLNGDRWSEEIRVSAPGVDGWDPAVTVDPSGRAYVAWDAYAYGNYDIFLRSYAEGKLSDLIQVTHSPNFEAHADLASSRDGKVWLAWDESGPNWGKDTGYELVKAKKLDNTSLWDGRKVQVACWENGILKRPRGDLFAAIPRDWETLMELPRLAADSNGRIWLFFRRRTLRFQATKVGPQAAATRVVGRGGRWDVYATTYSGDAWSPLISFPDSSGRNDVRLSAFATPDGSVWTAWETDQRPYDTFGPGDSAVVLARMNFGGPAVAPPVVQPQMSAPPRESMPESSESADVARVRGYQVSVGGKSYRIYRGDLHRHTDISFDGFADGSLLDLYRYAIDCARLDFVAVTDHGAGNHEYPWWRTQKSADLFFLANTFVPLYGYERSLSYPNGHRNVFYAHRGVRTLKTAREEETGKEGAARLFAWLKRTQGVSIPHTSATEMGTDWRDNDPEVEPLVEIFQGLRASYEYPEAPRSDIKDYPNMFLGQLREKGFVWNAWAKGYKLGVEASSDHGSTHLAYSCLYATALTRDALLDAIRQRHSYAATDNIVLDFRMEDKSAGEHMMGDIVSTRTTPVFVIHIDGTANLKQVDIIKSNRIVYTASPAANSFALRYVDNHLEPGEAYYYVRAEQEDGQMAWSSPIWVTYRP